MFRCRLLVMKPYYSPWSQIRLKGRGGGWGGGEGGLVVHNKMVVRLDCNMPPISFHILYKLFFNQPRLSEAQASTGHCITSNTRTVRL